MTCEGTAVATANQYTNIGTVTGTPPPTVNPDGSTAPSDDVTDDDPANVFGRTVVDSTTVPPVTVAPTTVQPGAQLPKTGGDRYTPLYMASLLLAAGVSLLWLRRRRQPTA